MVNGYALRRLYFYDSNQRGSKQWVVGVAGGGVSSRKRNKGGVRFVYREPDKIRNISLV